MIKVENITVYHKRDKDKIYLLKDICFSLNKGDSLGIIGTSGSGKSTLAKSLIEMYDDGIYKESGNVIINGHPFASSLRGKTISIMFQNPNSYLNPLMKVGNQISEMLIYHEKEKKNIAKERVINFMNKVGITDAKKVYNYYPYEISGGVQQLVCLCICLICNPEILILDESTSYLDKESKENIILLIKSLQKELNFTLIVISHDFKEIYKMCNKIAIMSDGKMIEFGTKNEIILQASHPCTLNLLITYNNFLTNNTLEFCSDNNSESDYFNFINLSDTHYVRGKLSSYKNNRLIKKMKEDIYEHLNTK